MSVQVGWVAICSVFVTVRKFEPLINWITHSRLVSILATFRCSKNVIMLPYRINSQCDGLHVNCVALILTQKIRLPERFQHTWTSVVIVSNIQCRVLMAQISSKCGITWLTSQCSICLCVYAAAPSSCLWSCAVARPEHSSLQCSTRPARNERAWCIIQERMLCSNCSARARYTVCSTAKINNM